jgi:hypothetical protein
MQVEQEHNDLYDMLKDWARQHSLSLPITREQFFRMIVDAHLREKSDYYTLLKKAGL